MAQTRSSELAQTPRLALTRLQVMNNNQPRVSDFGPRPFERVLGFGERFVRKNILPFSNIFFENKFGRVGFSFLRAVLGSGDANRPVLIGLEK